MVTESNAPQSNTIAGVVLAAGSGTRLRPLTHELPKALCPVANIALVDWALDSLGTVTPDLAVNTHHGAEAIHQHLGSREGVKISYEEPVALGTAGALARLASWIGDRPVVAVNADMWHNADLVEFVQRWRGEDPAVLTTTPGPFGPRSDVVASITAPQDLATLAERPSGMWESLWSARVEEGRLQTVHTDALAVDCGRPSDYLSANLLASGGASVIAEDATVLGKVTDSVVWSGATVGPTEELHSAIRTPRVTVLIR